MIVSPFVKYVFYRGVLPLSLLFAAFLRPCFLSVVYLIFALISPVLPGIHPAYPLPGSIRAYSWLCFLYCLLTTASMTAYQTYSFVTMPLEKRYVQRCNDWDMRWFRYVGLVSCFLVDFDRYYSGDTALTELQFHGGDAFESAKSILPEIVAFFASLTSAIVVAVLSHRTDNLDVVGNVRPVRMPNEPVSDNKSSTTSLVIALKRFSNFAIIMMSALVGCIQPSVLNFTYFMAFLLVTTWWALYKPLRHSSYNKIKQVFYHLLMLQLLWTFHGSRNYIDENDDGSSIHEELLNTNEDDGGDQRGQAIPLRKITSQVVDRKKLEQLFGENNPAAAASKGMVAIIAFALYHSYTFALLAMMTWALLYHSIFGLILLLVACILWMFKDSRGASFAMAPTLTIYIEFLLLTQYACSLNLTPKELLMPTWMNMVGFTIAPNMWAAFITIVVKLLLSLPVFLLLRLSIRETFYETLTDHERIRRLQGYGTFRGSGEPASNSQRNPGGTDIAADFVQWLSLQFTKVSIFFVAFVLLLVACQAHPVLYTIGFFCIWSLLIVYFKTSFAFFCRIAYPFWLSLIIYTSVVIISLYVYQFPHFPQIWTQWTGLDKRWNDDIGLINYSNVGESGTLFVRLFTPISLFVVAMLQLKFFHEPWLSMVRRGAPDEGAPDGTQLSGANKPSRWDQLFEQRR
ncbi:unnamed protein product [Nippostrongylus brasiliensis]|uniref:Piezo-type mechanosensitive ion channel component n=1 Tax=Nippostrongylus brasiliensis TaxID=27835 RepID=A0A158QWY7_NIPBR|nr:unnamed protein product [Nippostrongylus brasiliensis]